MAAFFTKFPCACEQTSIILRNSLLLVLLVAAALQNRYKWRHLLNKVLRSRRD